MKKAWSRGVLGAVGLAGVGLLVFGCSQGGGGTTGAGTATGTGTGAATKPAGDSVGAPECDEVLKKAAAADCKDKPGVAAISANKDNWARGISESMTKDATITACKAAMDTLKQVCSMSMPGSMGAGPGASAGPGSSASPGSSAAAGGDESVGAPECDEILKLASSPSCKDKPGMSAITANRGNWKNGLAMGPTREVTIMACKAAMDAIKAAGCSAGGDAAGGAWDGKAPYKCMGNDSAVITGVTANITSGPAVDASGNCKVTFKDCNITTDRGVSASGNAEVTLEGGELKASDTAIEGSGAAKVDVKGTKVTGKVKQSGGAKITGVPVTP